MQPVPVHPPAATSVLVLIPVFNDWEAVGHLLPRLDQAVAELDREVSVLLIDDGSTDEPGEEGGAGFSRPELPHLRQVETLRLRRNLGHQRAIAIGLAWVHEHRPDRTVVVMDGDGEDRPDDVPRLLAELDTSPGAPIVFAERTRRFEPLWFRLAYRLFRTIHRLLTGIPVKVGNFSVIPRRRLAALVVVSELWNHYAAAVFKSRIPYTTLPTTRGRRLGGTSRMNFVALLTHGLSAISVFGETVGARLLVATALSFVGLLVAFGAVFLLAVDSASLLTGPSLGLLFVLLLLGSQAVLLSAGALFLVLYSRNRYDFLPLRDYEYFVQDLRTLR